MLLALDGGGKVLPQAGLLGPLFFFSLVYIKIGNFKLGNFASFDFLTPPPHFKTVTYVFSILLCQWALNKRRTEVFSLNIHQNALAL